jgi:anionic cell wall polymer biosynthesis LytR-Cps2A-Psr (LCP) family protein
MKQRRRILVLAAALVLGSLIFMVIFVFASNGMPWGSASIDEVVGGVAEQRAAFLEEHPDVDFGDENEINILLLGLDARKGMNEPHCDAIHMFTIDVEDWTVDITSVPRGTYAYIPPGTYAETEYYIANACAFAGLDYGIEQIEKVLGVKTDYYVTVGFSQVLGIVRLFDLPATETLQFLRHRQGYAIGDPQRSHNQAVFMKDLMLSQLDRFRGDFGSSMVYVFFTMVNTDMDFVTAKALLDGMLESGIDERPEDIRLYMRPYYETVDYHFDPETTPEELEKRLEYLDYFLSDADLSNKSLEEIQAELTVYLESRIASDESLADVFDKALWLQIEDDDDREDLHYRLVEQHAYQLVEQDEDAAMDLLTDYIIEKETLGPADYAKRAKGLQNYLLSE